MTGVPLRAAVDRSPCRHRGRPHQYMPITIDSGWTRPTVRSAGQKPGPVRNGVSNRSGFLGSPQTGRPLDGCSSGHLVGLVSARRGFVAPGLQIRIRLSRKRCSMTGAERSSRRTLIGYARASTSGHDLAAHRDGLAALGVDDQHVHVDHGLSARLEHGRASVEHWLRAVPATSLSSPSSTVSPLHCATRPTSRMS